MSPMEQLAKQEYERGYSDGKSDYFAAGVAEGEMRARQRMIANRVVANQHPFAASGKPIDHIASTGKMIGCAYCDNPLFAGTKCNNCGRVTIAEPANTRSTSEYLEPVKQEPVAFIGQGLKPIVPEDLEKLRKSEPGMATLYDTPLYAAPAQQVDLTDDEIGEAAWKINKYAHYIADKCVFLHFARAVIAKFKEKNK